MNVSEEKRSGIDRRCGKDRRKAHEVDYFLNGGVERRSRKERRVGGERREGWVRVSEWSSMFVGSLRSNTKELIVERRKHKRFGLGREPVAVAFVTKSAPEFCTAGRVTDIGDAGLALSHFGGRLPPGSSLDLHIILSGGIASMQKLTGDSIWAMEVQGEPRERRCGIRFRNLTDDQKGFLEYIIRNYTSSGTES